MVTIRLVAMNMMEGTLLQFTCVNRVGSVLARLESRVYRYNTNGG